MTARPLPLALTVEPLENAHVRLEPIGAEHAEGLRAAAASGVEWRFMPMDLSGGGFDPWFEASCAASGAGAEIAYAVRRLKDSVLCGSTRFLAIVPEHRRCEIGWTWYAKGAQGTVVNPSAKLLLFTHAFAAGANRVELKCDALNARSRAAILKLGAIEEGTLRSHMVMPDGRIRNTVYFSVTADEWPGVRANLMARTKA